MPQRNLYVVLGISPQASQAAIRAAYRSLAKRYHPDHVGPGGESRFREVNEAYRVLSSFEGRRTHDRELRVGSVGPRAENPIPEPLRAAPRPPFAEPLIAEPFSLQHGLHLGRPSLEGEFLDWTMRHFAERGLPKSGREQQVDVEVVLTRDEAEQGGALPIELPSYSPCPACDGRGREWLLDCPRCSGEGMIDRGLTLRLRLPPRVQDGTAWDLPLLDAGLRIRIYVRVDPSS